MTGNGNPVSGGAKWLMGAAFDSGHNLLAYLDIDFEIVFINRPFAAIYGFEADPSAGRNFFDYIRDENIRRSCETAAETGISCVLIATPLPLGAGRAGDRFYDWVIAPDISPSGECNGFFLSLVDVTSRIEAEEACRRQEEFLHAIVEEQTELICRLRQDGTLTFTNGAYQRCFGSGGESLLGRLIWDFIPPAEHQRIRSFFFSCTPECPVQTFVHRAVQSDGEIRWRFWSIRAFFDRDGEVAEFQSVGRDITELKQVEQSLEEALQKAENAQAAAEAVIDSLGVAMHIVDRELTIQKQNRLSIDLFGDRRGKPCHEMLKEEGQGREVKSCPVAEILQNGMMHQEKRVIETACGSMHVEITASPFKDGSGEVVAAIVLLHDITQAKKDVEALATAREELERRVAERTRELEQANEKLRKEAAARSSYEEKLERRSRELEEANIALNVLLKKSSAAQGELENRIVDNLKTSIFPFFDELEGKLGKSPESEYLQVIRNNLLEITSPFAQKLDSKLVGLTAREIQTATFVRQGKTNKEIADLLRVSEGTIKTYRNKIREKLGITNQKVNLRSFLLSLARGSARRINEAVPGPPACMIGADIHPGQS